MESYDPHSNSWEIIPAKMMFHRTFLGAAVLDGKVYAVGGGTNSVERFDPSTQEWSMVTSMRKFRTGPGVVAHEGFIYCVGGACSDKTIASRTTERYDPETDQWVWLSNMSSKRRNPAMAVMNGYIYAIGGIGADGKWLASVERLDPINNQWEKVIDMPIAYRGLSAAVM
jgi:N-acetylneuraminic acid mutarotase